MRSIPACAGEPSGPDQSAGVFGVYPRVCGGARMNLAYSNSCWGLSPRVRGSHSTIKVGGPFAGSIPACAGEPAVRPSAPGSLRVYPRVCGGAWMASFTASSASGLSPRVRGSHLDDGRGVRAVGSIPACAGEPLVVTVVPHSRQVYPRVCGEPDHTRASQDMERVYPPRVCGGARAGYMSTSPTLGLSPRVRGSLDP